MYTGLHNHIVYNDSSLLMCTHVCQFVLLTFFYVCTFALYGVTFPYGHARRLRRLSLNISKGHRLDRRMRNAMSHCTKITYIISRRSITRHHNKYNSRPLVVAQKLYISTACCLRLECNNKAENIYGDCTTSNGLELYMYVCVCMCIYIYAHIYIYI